jgi:hypothetical protein
MGARDGKGEKPWKEKDINSKKKTMVEGRK